MFWSTNYLALGLTIKTLRHSCLLNDLPCFAILPIRTRRFLASGDVRLMAVMSCVLSIHMMTGSTGPLAFRLNLCLTGSKSCDDILIAPGADWMSQRSERWPCRETGRISPASRVYDYVTIYICIGTNTYTGRISPSIGKNIHEEYHQKIYIHHLGVLVLCPRSTWIVYGPRKHIQEEYCYMDSIGKNIYQEYLSGTCYMDSIGKNIYRKNITISGTCYMDSIGKNIYFTSYMDSIGKNIYRKNITISGTCYHLGDG